LRDAVSDAETTIARGRAKSVLDWLRGRADTGLGRLSLQWFRAYFEASRNSGCAATVYSSLSVLPAALIFAAYFHPSGGDANIFAQRLITHLHLTGDTASLVQGTFGTTSANSLAATLSVVVSFLLWGIGIGQIYQDVYARAWGLKVGSPADQGLFAIFFFVMAGGITLALISAARFQDTGWIVLLPGWIVASTAFWLLVPQMLLHRKVSLRALLPGALLASLVLGGTIATSPFFLAPTLNQNGRSFGSFGVVLTTIGYAFVMITMSLVCAVFSPVWSKWREGERLIKEAAPSGSRSPRPASRSS
jgi:membrane protein